MKLAFWRRDNDLKARVARGVKLLDNRVPDWREHVDVVTLNQASSYYCVLGQLNRDGYDGYFGMTEKLGLTDKDVVSHGFDLEDNPSGFVELDDLWIEAIENE